ITLQKTLDRTADFARQGDARLAQSEAAIQEVLSQFHSSGERILDSAQSLEQESAGVQSNVEEVLVNLQFQDRVGQILSHITDDMEKLLAVVNEQHKNVKEGDDFDEIDIDLWLKSVRETYTTLEQVAIHRGDSAIKKPEDSSITYF